MPNCYDTGPRFRVFLKNVCFGGFLVCFGGVFLAVDLFSHLLRQGIRGYCPILTYYSNTEPHWIVVEYCLYYEYTGS